MVVGDSAREIASRDTPGLLHALYMEPIHGTSVLGLVLLSVSKVNLFPGYNQYLTSTGWETLKSVYGPAGKRTGTSRLCPGLVNKRFTTRPLANSSMVFEHDSFYVGSSTLKVVYSKHPRRIA